MNFWQKLFSGKKKKRLEEDNWEEVVCTREGVDFHNSEERLQYVEGCLGQLDEAARELELLSGEYSQVTAYLTDMEEVEALPDSAKEPLMNTVRRLNVVEQERKNYLEKKDRMPDAVYYRMREKEDELEEGIKKLAESERFGGVIKQDMQRLSGERHAYAYRRDELISIMENLKRIIMIVLIALVVCIIILVVLQIEFKMNTQIGYFVAVVSAAVAFTVIWVKHMDADKELLRVEKATNKLIQLQNRVKVKYVNNTNLLNYLYLKYQVDSLKTLEKQYSQYLQEKEERKQYAEAEAKRDYYIRLLTEQLVKYRVRYPEKFTANTEALLNHKEFVEMRHELIIQRQALRKQMDYNSEVVRATRHELNDLIYLYPEYSQEISRKLEACEKKYSFIQ